MTKETFMKLGTKGRYAVMALVDLAYHSQGKPLALTEIALRQSLPLTYLEQLFVKLRKQGFVVSTRGTQGGYTLARDAEVIRIGEILEAIGEPIKTTRCTRDSETGCLGIKGQCLTHALWAGLGREMHQYLNSISLADVCQRRLS
jgi:Rrf2 family iron-sulfur cluster assembly transcriptional regulator